MAKKQTCNERLDQVGLIQSTEEENIAFNDNTTAPAIPFRRCISFKDFPFPRLPVPFLYVCQLFLHVFLLFLPVIHIIVMLILSKDALSGVNILTAVLNTVGWICGFHALKHERYHLFMTKAKRHSIFMLLFWGVVLLLEFLVFVSWESLLWYLKNHDNNTKFLDLIMFCFRLSAKVLVFLLGLHAPGLYKQKYEKVCIIFCFRFLFCFVF